MVTPSRSATCPRRSQLREAIDEMLKQGQRQKQSHDPRLAKLPVPVISGRLRVTVGCTTRWMLSPLNPLLWLTRSTSSNCRLICRPIFGQIGQVSQSLVDAEILGIAEGAL